MYVKRAQNGVLCEVVFGWRTCGVLGQLFAAHTLRVGISLYLLVSLSRQHWQIFPSFLGCCNCIQCIWNYSPCDAVAMWRNRFRFRKQSSCCFCSRWDAAHSVQCMRPCAVKMCFVSLFFLRVRIVVSLIVHILLMATEALRPSEI